MTHAPLKEYAHARKGEVEQNAQTQGRVFVHFHEVEKFSKKYLQFVLRCGSIQTWKQTTQQLQDKRKEVTTMKKIDFKNDERTAVMDYLTAKADKAAAEKREKQAKAVIKGLMERMGRTFKETEKSSYVYGTVQVKGEAKAVVYRETTAKGTIDWQAYAMALGGTEEGAEEYRKPDQVRTSFDWATKDQQKEINS